MDHGMGEVSKEKKFRGRTDADGGELVSDPVPVPEAARPAPTAKPSEVARVRYALGVTLNMGDYRSVRVDVAVEMPCKPSKDSIELVHAFGKGWCEKKINDEIEAWTGERPVKFLPDPPEDTGRKRR